MSAPTQTRRATVALTVLCLAQLAFILDISVVNVALVPLAREWDAEAGQLALVAGLYRTLMQMSRRSP